MATSLVTFQSFGISASSTSGSSSRKSPTQSRRSSSPTGWSFPNFGWSADQPDYNIDSTRSSSPKGSCSSSGDVAVCGEDERKGRLRQTTGNFTEEKARQLRMMTTGMEMSHEKMYHSAIASRLASDFSDCFIDDMI